MSVSRVMIIAAPLTGQGGTIRRLRLWLENLPPGVHVRLLCYCLGDTASVMRSWRYDPSRAAVVQSRWLCRAGRVTYMPAAIRIGVEIRRWRPDHVLTMFPWMHVVGGSAVAQMARARVHYASHCIYLAADPAPAGNHRALRGVYRWLFQQSVRTAHSIVVLSDGLGAELERQYTIPQRVRMTTVPIAVVPGRPRPCGYERADPGVVFGIAARLVRIKGVDVALTAFANMQTKDARLVIWGGGPERDRLELHAERLGIRARVEFRGWVEEVVEEMAGIDCLLQPSYSEGTPRAILEACSIGVPVVATRVGGVADIVRDGETGWLVPCGDAERMAATMDRLAAHRSMLAAAGDRCHREARRRPGPADEMRSLIAGIAAGAAR